MTSNSDNADAEITAISNALKALEGLSTESQERVVAYLLSRLGLAKNTATRPLKAVNGTSISGEPVLEADDFPSLYDVASPTTDPERALVAGYYHQVVQGATEFESQRLNTALKNLGHGIKNITEALESLKARRPALVIQVSKSGKTKQGRKKYKLTTAGVRRVERMASGRASEEEHADG